MLHPLASIRARMCVGQLVRLQYQLAGAWIGCKSCQVGQQYPLTGVRSGVGNMPVRGTVDTPNAFSLIIIAKEGSGV